MIMDGHRAIRGITGRHEPVRRVAGAIEADEVQADHRPHQRDSATALKGVGTTDIISRPCLHAIIGPDDGMDASSVESLTG